MNNIKAKRLNLGLTRLELAKKLGVNRSTITQLENNDINLSYENACAIAHAMNSDPFIIAGEEMLKKVSALTSVIYSKTENLESQVVEARKTADSSDSSKTAFFYREHVFAAMNELRTAADELETITPKEMWPFPSYGDLLFSVK